MLVWLACCSSQCSCEEEQWCRVSLKISNSCRINGIKKKKPMWRGGRETGYPHTKIFQILDIFLFCTNTNSRSPKWFSIKKIERGLFRNNGEPEGRASCVGSGRCSWLWVTVQPLEFGSPTFLMIWPKNRKFLAMRRGSLGFCWGILARSWGTFPGERAISINMFSQRLVMNWHCSVDVSWEESQPPNQIL